MATIPIAEFYCFLLTFQEEKKEEQFVVEMPTPEIPGRQKWTT